MMMKRYSRYEKQIIIERDEPVSTMRRRNANGRTNLIGLILAILLINMGISPVMAVYIDNGPQTTYYSKDPVDTLKPRPPTPVFNYSILSPEKLKISKKLLYLLYPDIIAMNLSSKDPVVNLQNAKGYLQYQNLYKPGNVTIENGVTIQSSPDLVLVGITMRPGNSTHILDPYIYELYGRSERLHKVDAWVEVPNLEKIALIPEVRWIDTVHWIVYNVGGYETEGNSTLHAKEILELPNYPGGEGIRVGVLSDGVANITDAQSSGDLPDVTIGNVGKGDEGTALLEIIHDLAPNGSLFFLRRKN